MGLYRPSKIEHEDECDRPTRYCSLLSLTLNPLLMPAPSNKPFSSPAKVDPLKPVPLIVLDFLPHLDAFCTISLMSPCEFPCLIVRRSDSTHLMLSLRNWPTSFVPPKSHLVLGSQPQSRRSVRPIASDLLPSIPHSVQVRSMRFPKIRIA